MDQTGAKVRATKSHRNFSQRMHLIHPHCTLNTCFGVFCTIWMYLEPFGCLTKLCAKQAKLVQKYVPWSRFGMFHNEPLNPPHWTLTSCFRAFCTTWVHLGQFGSITTLSTKWAKFLATNARDPPHWTLNSYFGVFFFYLDAFGTVWLPFKTQCKTSRTGAKDRATKSRHNFSQRTNPIDPVGT